MRRVLVAGVLIGSLVAQLREPILTASSATPSVAGSQPATPSRPLGDTALLPPDGAVGAWKKADNPRVYSRADLYGYIDGGAELFFEFGFEELTQQKYRLFRSTSLS